MTLRLTEDALDWALQHALNYGDTDLFPPCFEFRAIEHEWASLKTFLADVDLDTWAVRTHRRCLAPKSRYAFRVATQLDPLDFLLYTAAVYEIGADLEAARVERTRNIVFSYRFDPDDDGRMFARSIGYSDFVSATRAALGSPQFQYVVTADIADFYPKVYFHPLENALDAATSKRDHVRCILKLLNGWSDSVSHGLPVGNAASRMIAEVTIADVDEALLANRVRFVRYNDDYRIFAQTFGEAYRHLALLANHLYEVHGLTLAPHKTRVMPRDLFVTQFLPEPEEQEVNELQARFQQLLEAIDLGDWYAEIDYDDLDPEQQELIDGLNLRGMFQTEAGRETPDLQVLRFVLRRMSQLGSDELVDVILENLDALHPVVPDIVRYLGQIRGLTVRERGEIGERWLSAFEESVLWEIEYHRSWVLSLFADSNDWDNEEAILPLMAELTDGFSKRKLVLALGRSGGSHWFRANRRSELNQGSWSRRAFIAGASCMPGDQRTHWYRSIKGRLDPLERSVMEWAKTNPFG